MARVHTPLYLRYIDKEKKKTHVLKPAFGRDYSSAQLAADAWKLGATFIHDCGRDCGLEDRYVNDVTFYSRRPGDTVQIVIQNGAGRMTVPKDTTLWGVHKDVI
jgi:hypothetical protein